MTITDSTSSGNSPTFMTAAEFAAEQRISPFTASRWFSSGWRSGRCPKHYKVGNRIRIRRSDYLLWVEARISQTAGIKAA